MKNQTKGFIFLVTGVTLYAMLSIFVKIIYSLGIPEASVTPIFILIMVISSIAYVYINNKGNFKVKKGKLKYLIIQGVIANGMTTAFFYKSLVLIDASVAIMLLYSNCIFVMLFEVLFKKNKISKIGIISMMSVIIGLALSTGLVEKSVNVSLLGIIYGVIASIGYAVQNVNIEENLHDINHMAAIMYAQVFALITMVVLYNPLEVFNFTPTLLNITVLIIGALITGLAPQILQFKGILILGAYKSSIISTAELPITALMAFIVLSERTSIIQIIGMLFIIYGGYNIQKH